MPRVRIRRLTLAAEAAAMLTAAGLRLRWHPQQKTASLLGQAQPSVAPAPAPASASAYAEALPIGRAVERVAAVLPWHPVCLPRAVAVAWMLRRRGIDCRAHLGVTATAAKEAHAWVTVGGVVVQGAPIDDITELASFV